MRILRTIINHWFLILVLALAGPGTGQETTGPATAGEKEAKAEGQEEAKNQEGQPETGGSDSVAQSEDSEQAEGEDEASDEDAAEDESTEGRILLALVDFGTVNFSLDEAAVLADSARERFRGIGLYNVMTRKKMAETFTSVRKTLPKTCNGIICLHKVGKVLFADKVAGGEISSDGSNYAVKMSMLDVRTGKKEGTVWLASECSWEQIPQLIQAAILRLHGQAVQGITITVKDYRGPEFSKHGQWLTTAGATLAAGLFWAALDGGLVGKDKNEVSIAEANRKTDDSPLSGIPAAFLHMGYGSRAHALGYAYVAVSNDASGILWNPAGIARAQNAEVAAAGFKYFIPVANLGYVNRFSRTGGYGAALLYSGDRTLSELEFVTATAKLFDEIHPNLRPFSLGANLELRTSSFGKEGSGTERITGNSFGLGMDLGMQFELADHIHLGLVARDLISYQKYNNTALDTKYSEGVPASLIIGGSFQAGPTMLMVADGAIPVYDDQEYKLSMGIERVVFGVLALRIGVFQHLAFWENRRITGGLGLLIHGFSCDASYEWAQEKLFQGPPRVSVSWKF